MDGILYKGRMNSKDRARPLTDTEKELAGEEHQAFLGTPDPCPAFAGHCEAQCDAGGAQSRQHPRLGAPHTATHKHGILLYARHCTGTACDKGCWGGVLDGLPKEECWVVMGEL